MQEIRERAREQDKWKRRMQLMASMCGVGVSPPGGSIYVKAWSQGRNELSVAGREACFRGIREKGNALCLEVRGDFKEQPGVLCGPAPERRKAGNEVHFHKHFCSSHELPPPLGKKSLTFNDSPEPPLLCETVRAPRLPDGASGLSTALWWVLLSVLPAENELLKDRFCSLSLVIKMSSKYRMNLQMNPRRNDANIFFHLHLGPLETGYSRNPGLLLERI